MVINQKLIKLIPITQLNLYYITLFHQFNSVKTNLTLLTRYELLKLFCKGFFMEDTYGSVLRDGIILRCIINLNHHHVYRQQFCYHYNLKELKNKQRRKKQQLYNVQIYKEQEMLLI